VAKGQAFLAEVYETLVSNPARWANTMMIVTYDEHGGFFDHVPPISMPTTIAGQSIPTTGVRVPACLISPWVQAGDVFKGALDHTSILQLLVDRFAPNEGYSPEVNERQARLNRLKQALDETVPGHQSPNLSEDAKTVKDIAAITPVANSPSGSSVDDPANAQAFHQLALKLAAEQPEKLESPGWAGVKAYVVPLAPLP
jgi:phospholipase C